MTSDRLVSSFGSFVLFTVMSVFITVAASNGAELPFVSPMFGDHMVLQRGQSNMELPLNRTRNGGAAIAAASQPEKFQGALKLRFDQSLVIKGDKLEEFAIAGEDRKRHWAEAKVAGDSVVVSSPRGTLGRPTPKPRFSTPPVCPRFRSALIHPW